MLTSEVVQELGRIIRSLERKLTAEPELRASTEEDALDHIERAIVALVMVHINLRRKPPAP